MEIGNRRELLGEYAAIPVDKVPYRNTHRYLFPEGLTTAYDAGDRIASVTTVLGIVDKSSALLPWAEKRALEYMSAKMRAGFTEGLNDADRHEQIKLLVAEVKEELANDSAVKLDFGSAVHDYLNELFRSSYLADTGLPDMYILRVNTPQDVSVGIAAMAAVEWLQQQEAVKVWPEETLFHPYGQLPPGQADMIFSKPDGKLAVVDWKCASGIYDAHCWQVATYAVNLARLTGRGWNDVEAWVVKLPTPDNDKVEDKQVTDITLGAKMAQKAAELYEVKGQATMRKMTEG